MENVKNAANNLKDNIADNLNNIKENIVNVGNNIKEKLPVAPGMPDLKPDSGDSFFSKSKEFLSSNTLVAKATFLLFIIILFSFLFYIFSKLLMNYFSPSPTPYLLYGMKDATSALTIKQSLSEKKAVPIMRSKDEYDGIEFTYSFWIYVKDVNLDNKKMMHVFHKGGTQADGDGIYSPNNAPGVYLYKGRRAQTAPNDDLIEDFKELGMLVRLNIFHDNDDNNNPYKYYDDIHVDGIPIKKWVGVIVRLTSQNVLDVYINGTLAKRHKLTNVAKQNYDNIHINKNGGFNGNMSNLRYYNYAIGTFEINSITTNGPNLKMAKDSNITNSKPAYLSSDWYFTDSSIIDK